MTESIIDTAEKCGRPSWRYWHCLAVSHRTMGRQFPGSGRRGHSPIQATPVNVSVVRGNGYLDVSWTAPTGGGTPTGYHVVASGDYKKSWWRAATGVNPTPVNGRLTYRVTGDIDGNVSISNQVVYYVSVSAVNGSGGSSWRGRRAHPSLSAARPASQRQRYPR